MKCERNGQVKNVEQIPHQGTSQKQIAPHMLVPKPPKKSQYQNLNLYDARKQLRGRSCKGGPKVVHLPTRKNKNFGETIANGPTSDFHLEHIKSSYDTFVILEIQGRITDFFRT